jgi:DNA-binding NtrC family response regulator
MVQVLIVDGDDAISETMRDILEEAGHSVLQLADCAEALAFLSASRSCCVVLFDWGVPGVCNTAFFEAIVGDEMLFTRHAYICMTTDPLYLSHAERTIFDRLAIPIVAKPFDIGDLEDAVRQSARLCKLLSPQRAAG